MKETYPIGVFDSGLGGLNVLKELRKALPYEDFVYLADNLNCPYGTKPKMEIIRLVSRAISYFQHFPVKLLILACNTTSAYLDLIKLRTTLPILGIVLPTAKLAKKAPRSKGMALLATNATIDSGVYQNLLQSRNKKRKIHFIKCSEFVEAIEAGEVGSDYSKHLVYTKLDSLKEGKIERIILACTHFDLYKEEIQLVLPEAKILSSAQAMAKALEKFLKSKNLRNKQKQTGSLRFYMTDDLENFQKRTNYILFKESFELITLEK